MTTLIYNHKTNEIGIDSRITADGQIMSDCAIKWDTSPGGDIWFYAGCPVDMNKAMGLFEDITKTQAIPAGENHIGFGAVIASKGKAYLCYYTSSNQYVIEKADHNQNFGSGGMYGLCALNLGKSTIDAVDFAKTMDAYSGGKTKVFNVTKMRFVYKEGL
jgi:hypothetical protein